MVTEESFLTTKSTKRPEKFHGKRFSVENKSVILVLNPNDQLNIQAFPFPTEKQTDVLANYERYKTIVTPVIDLIKNVT
ncbi:MAG: hypothetical protein WCR34_05615, partial [Bacilli bacterium]